MPSEIVSRSITYPVVDQLPFLDVQAIAINAGFITENVQKMKDRLRVRAWSYRHVRAVWTGEKRCPEKDEYYLSGSDISAYRAFNRIATRYHIARIVWVETTTTETIHEI